MYYTTSDAVCKVNFLNGPQSLVFVLDESANFWYKLRCSIVTMDRQLFGRFSAYASCALWHSGGWCGFLVRGAFCGGY